MNGFDDANHLQPSKRKFGLMRRMEGASAAASSAPFHEGTPTFAARMHEFPEDRKQLIFRIRRQISEGGYDTPEKLEAAVERMFERLADASQ